MYSYEGDNSSRPQIYYLFRAGEERTITMVQDVRDTLFIRTNTVCDVESPTTQSRRRDDASCKRVQALFIPTCRIT